LSFDVVLVEGMLTAADGTISQRHPLSGWWALLMIDRRAWAQDFSSRLFST
jgi:hypothetical protein